VTTTNRYKMLSWAVLLVVVVVVAGQNRDLLPPETRHCGDRDLHLKYGNHWYFFSWLNPQSSKLAADWLDARNICRRHCMDLVSLETPDENNMIKAAMAANDMPWIWTSGRLCDFEGCEARQDLQPIPVKGWFWSGSDVTLPDINSPLTDWSPAGGDPNTPGAPNPETGKVGQPDNREVPEACLAILNNIYNDTIKWHDINCFHAKPFVCEDSDSLIGFVTSQQRGAPIVRGVTHDLEPNDLTNPFQTYPDVVANGRQFRLAGRR